MGIAWVPLESPKTPFQNEIAKYIEYIIMTMLFRNDWPNKYLNEAATVAHKQKIHL